MMEGGGGSAEIDFKVPPQPSKWGFSLHIPSLMGGNISFHPAEHVKIPNRFHRWAQRWFLGVHWHSNWKYMR